MNLVFEAVRSNQVENKAVNSKQGGYLVGQPKRVK